MIKIQSILKTTLFNTVILLYTLITVSTLYAQTTVTGIVFHDINENGVYDTGEYGIPGVHVSNGSDIVRTDSSGKYEIEVDDNTIVFVIKPKGWKTPVNENNIPQFYTIYSSTGASGDVYPGLDPTEEWPESVDFPLYKNEESDQFRVVVFADTQPRTIEEVNYVAHDTVQELIGVDAAFGTTLGDIVYDNLNLFEPLNQVIGQIGIPWRHVIGNHDIDHSADTDWDARGAYMRTYGPSWYAFTYGSSHFVVVDNLRWIVEGENRFYRTGLGEEQIKFIENFLKSIPDDELVVFMMHIPWVHSTPWVDEQERQQLFEVMATHSNAISLVGHTHRHFHRFIGKDDDWYQWPGGLNLDDEYEWLSSKPHHMISMGAVWGQGWSGAPDEYGIPHSMMRDGTPTGYGILEIDGSDYKLSFKAARRPADFQMHISAPDEITATESNEAKVFANIFNALPDARVEMKIGNGGEWQPMYRVEERDPVFTAMVNRERELEEITWRRAGTGNPDAKHMWLSMHLWKASIPEELGSGTYTIFVRAEDKWHQYEGRRIIRIVD
jgi:hypothetical protein